MKHLFDATMTISGVIAVIILTVLSNSKIPPVILAPLSFALGAGYILAIYAYYNLNPKFKKIIQASVIADLKESLTIGIENTRMCLTDHDVTVGRTTERNKRWAEALERDLRQLEKTLAKLNSFKEEESSQAKGTSVSVSG